MSPNKHDEYPGPRGFLFLFFFAKERSELRSGDNLSPLGQGYMQKALTKESPLFWNYWATTALCWSAVWSVMSQILEFLTFIWDLRSLERKRPKILPCQNQHGRQNHHKEDIGADLLWCLDKNPNTKPDLGQYVKTSNFFKLYGSASSRSHSRSLFGGYLSLLLFLAFFPWESLWRRLYMAQLNKYKCL